MIHFMFEQIEKCYYTLASKSSPEFIDLHTDNCHKTVELSFSFYHFTTLKGIDESGTAL